MKQKKIFCVLYILCATVLCIFSCCFFILGILVLAHRIHLIEYQLLHRLPRIIAFSFFMSICGWILFRSTESSIASVLILTSVLLPIVWRVSHTVCISQIVISLYSCILRRKAGKKDANGWMAEKEWYLLPICSPIINGSAIMGEWYMPHPEYYILTLCFLYIILVRVMLRVYVIKSSVNWHKKEIKIVLCSEETLHINVGLSSLYHAMLKYTEYMSFFVKFYAFQEDFWYGGTVPVDKLFNNGIRLLSSHLRYHQITDWNALTIIYHQKSLDSIPLSSYRILQSYKGLGSNVIVMKENKETISSCYKDLQMINDDGIFVVQYDEEQYENARAFTLGILFSEIRPALEYVIALLDEVPNEERYAPIKLQLQEIICSQNQLEAFDRMLHLVEYIAMYRAYYRLCYDNTLGKYDISRMSFGQLSEIAWKGMNDKYVNSQNPHEFDKSIIDSITIICKALRIEFNPRVHLRHKEIFMLFVSLRNQCVHGSLIYYASHQLLISVSIVSVYLVYQFIDYDCLIEDGAAFLHSIFEKPVPCFSFDTEGNRYIFSRIIKDRDGKVSDDLSNVEYYSYEHGIIHGNNAHFQKF